MFETFQHTRFRTPAINQIALANVIITEYQQQGFKLTLRQLYYQFVARGLLDNTQREYKNLGNLISKARLAGLIDWNAIEDRTRNLASQPTWDSPSEIVAACADQFKLDIWEGQEYRPEVWIEKEALTGVIAPVCNRLRISYFACRGYVSQSEQWAAGKRIEQRREESNQATMILHLGDHDPSGLDMTRDNADRLSMFARFDCEVQRLALNMDQVNQYAPPPNPAKLTDTRANRYVARFGDDSWELDALEPRVIERLIEDAVSPLIDADLMDEVSARESDARARLREVANEL